jgi:hypothetical protein
MTMSEDFRGLEARLRNAQAAHWHLLDTAADAIAILRAERNMWEAKADVFQAERDAARAVTEWRDIATAPKNGTKVWAFGSGWFCPSIIAADGEWWRMRQAEGCTGQPTHWMPLQVPAPPLPLKAKP